MYTKERKKLPEKFKNYNLKLQKKIKIYIKIRKNISNKLFYIDLNKPKRKVAEFYPGQPVVIRADRETSYDSLVKVIDTCRNAGVWNFSLATVEEKR